MDERGTESKLCKKELRKQKLIDYLSAKGKLKPSNPRPYLRDAQVMKPTMCAVNNNMAMGKENQGLPNTLKINKETVKVQPLTVKAVSQTTLRSTTNKQSTNATLRTLSAVSATARHTAPKGTAQNTAPSRTASLKAAPVRPLTTAPIKASLGASDRHRAQSNMAVKVAARLNSGKAPQPNIGKSSNTIHTRPRTALNSVRMSLGTHAQTKTGLIPALVQPRNTQSKTTVPAPTATYATTVAPNRTQLNTTIPVSGPQKTVIAQRKPRSTTVVSKTVQRRTTTVANAKMKSQAPNRTDTKPLTVKPNQPPKPTHGPTGPKAAATKPGENRREAQTTKNTRVLTQVMEPVRQASPQRRSVFRGAGGATRTWMPASRAFTGTGSQWQRKALSRAVRATVAELGQKDSGSLPVTEENSGAEIGTGDIVTETNAPTTDLSSSPPCHRGTHRTGEIPPMNMAQTVPRSGRNANQVGWSTALKTPRVQTRVMPQTEQGKNKMTALQEDRMRKLQEWREARGISYKRPPMPVRPRVRRTVALPQPYWASMEMEDEADSLICAVDRSLADCIKLLEEGCLSKQVQDVLSKVPMAQKFSKYWICQARLMERQGNLEVLPLFEEAVRVVLEPVDELRTVVFEILKKKETQGQSPMPLDAEREEEKEGLQVDSDCETTEDPMATPKAFKALICGDKGDSSVVKYKITATPGGFRSQQREPVRLDGQEVRFFTPVRRSVRIDRASLRYPTSLQEHDPCVASYKDLVAQEESEREGEEWKDAEGEGTLAVYNTPLYIYRENEALRDQVHVQLVYDQD